VCNRRRASVKKPSIISVKNPKLPPDESLPPDELEEELLELDELLELEELLDELVEELLDELLLDELELPVSVVAHTKVSSRTLLTDGYQEVPNFSWPAVVG